MNPLLTTSEENFRAGEHDLGCCLGKLLKMKNGTLLYGMQGEALLTIDMNEVRLMPETTVAVLPHSVFSLKSASPDFKAHYFTFSEDMFNLCCFRLPPVFLHFLKENPFYRHQNANMLYAVRGLVQASNAVYRDHENRFREAIAQNLLQIFFLDVYDKAQRLFTMDQIERGSRREVLFKRFIDLVHNYCTSQREVTFYARQLCISTRYLSAITQQMEHESAKTIIDRHLMLELKLALRSTDLSMKELADKYHFPDQSFFGRYFKKHTGMSPKEFREKRK